jgi:hypothetical protein
LETQGQFDGWIQGLREAKQIRNDDVALVVIRPVR